MGKSRERRYAIFVLQAGNDADEIGEIFSIDSAVLHVFKQIVFERVFTGWGCHGNLLSIGFAGTSPKAKVGELLPQYAAAGASVNRRITAIAKEKIGKFCLDFSAAVPPSLCQVQKLQRDVAVFLARICVAFVF